MAAPMNLSPTVQRMRAGVVGCAIVFVACLAACSEPRSVQDIDARSQTPPPIVEHDVAVPMRDGVVLRADVFRPEGPGPFPVLVYRTPYGKEGAAESYETHLAAVRRGYAVVLQDVRGRYASEGRFEPYRNEGRDGRDTIEWAAAQPWSNGDVGTFGLSYPGAVQWLAALESPPHLKAMVPAMTFSSPRNFFYMNGVFDLSWLPWLYVNIAPDARERLDLSGIRSAGKAAQAWGEVADEYLGWLPLAGLPYLRDATPYYYQWLEHPPEDSWWDWAEIRGHYGAIQPAVLNLSGWYDEAYGPEGAVTNFRGLLAARHAGARARTHLLLGPWVHGVGATMSRQTGDLDFGPDAAIDYDEEILDFFDHYLRGADNRFASQPPVRYFMMGENRWNTATRWPPANAHFKSFYLTATGTLQPNEDTHHLLNPQNEQNEDIHQNEHQNRDSHQNGGSHRNRLPPNEDSHRIGQQNEDTHGGKLNRDSHDTTDGNADSYSPFVADPADPVVDPYGEFGPHDYRALAKREDLLTFDSAPFTEEVRAAGAMEAVIYASCDCRDFDLWVRVFDVYPDGRAINLMSPGNDMLRASYRNAAAGRQLLEPGRTYELRLSNLLTANAFAPDHQLRVQVSGSFAPHFSRNLQTGESEVRASAMHVATISIHHDREHASRIRVPVISTSAGE